MLSMISAIIFLTKVNASLQKSYDRYRTVTILNGLKIKRDSYQLYCAFKPLISKSFLF